MGAVASLYSPPSFLTRPVTFPPSRAGCRASWGPWISRGRAWTSTRPTAPGRLRGGRPGGVRVEAVRIPPGQRAGDSAARGALRGPRAHRGRGAPARGHAGNGRGSSRGVPAHPSKTLRSFPGARRAAGGPRASGSCPPGTSTFVHTVRQPLLQPCQGRVGTSR